jgi:MFS transporter, ACS family, hexuronate transporter
MTHFRWVVLGLLLLATTLNVYDRMVLGVLYPYLPKEISISESEYGWINFAFAITYALSQMGAGRLLDRIGTRSGYTLAVAAWSVFSMLTAAARGVWGFSCVRALLGVSESPNFPAATKTVAEWFPRRERAFAFGFINAGTNLAAIAAPLLVPFVATRYGWKSAFIVTGAMGLVWLSLWLWLYRRPEKHPAVSSQELAHINSDPAEATVAVPWRTLLFYRQTWAFAGGKFLTDCMWWFFLTWLTKFFSAPPYNLDLLHVGLPLVTIYLMADVGAVGGGWLSSTMIRRGSSVNRARKTALFVSALFALPIMFAYRVGDLWSAVLLVGMATAAHQGFSSNLFTLVSDMFPRRVVGSVAGFGGMFGYFGSSIFSVFVGYMVQYSHSYFGPFFCAALAYLTAFAVIHLLAPRLSPATL